jgi:ABC-type polysaccharide/polyol phosphate transport system ATPase subunit
MKIQFNVVIDVNPDVYLRAEVLKADIENIDTGCLYKVKSIKRIKTNTGKPAKEC